MSLDSGRLLDGAVPPELRQERIAVLVQDCGFARVADLATRFQVSTVTIRSDLQVMERRGKLRRIRGGAVPAGVEPNEQPFEASALTLASEKARIGAWAAKMVASGETVIVDVGTTTTALARALLARTDLQDVTVFTAALNIALELEPAYPRITVVVTGGTLRPLQHSLVNPLATVLLSGLRASMCFIGCNGVDVQGGITNINLPEAEVKRAMLLAAGRRVVVADGSKLGEVELAKVCDIQEAALIVTDPTADPAIVSEIKAAGCAVEVAV